MPNCADTAKFRVGPSADVIYVQFYIINIVCEREIVECNLFWGMMLVSVACLWSLNCPHEIID